MARTPRTLNLQTRVTPKEAATIQRAARRLKLSVSDVLRTAANLFCREAPK